MEFVSKRHRNILPEKGEGKYCLDDSILPMKALDRRQEQRLHYDEFFLLVSKGCKSHFSIRWRAANATTAIKVPKNSKNSWRKIITRSALHFAKIAFSKGTDFCADMPK